MLVLGMHEDERIVIEYIPTGEKLVILNNCESKNEIQRKRLSFDGPKSFNLSREKIEDERH